MLTTACRVGIARVIACRTITSDRGIADARFSQALDHVAMRLKIKDAGAEVAVITAHLRCQGLVALQETHRCAVAERRVHLRRCAGCKRPVPSADG
ncbi:hypothetical protein WIW49_03450 [Xanthomonas euroxanthea]